MVEENCPSAPEMDEPRHNAITCPFCEYGSLGPSQSEDYRICCECHRRVYEARVSAVRLERLLDSVRELLLHSFDEERGPCAHGACEDIAAELQARGPEWVYIDANPCPEGEPNLPVSICGTQGRWLSPTASQALNEMLRDHDFGEGPSFLARL